jgi:hypothetical protein
MPAGATDAELFDKTVELSINPLFLMGFMLSFFGQG